MTDDILIDDAPVDAPIDDHAVPAPAVQAMSGEQILAQIMSLPNIAQQLEDGEPGKLAEIAAKVCAEYEIDAESRKPWLEKIGEALKLAMLTAEQKDYPFEKASNVKYPLLTTAALQFNARAYPAIVTPDKVAKCKVRGRDPQGLKAARAERVSEHMSDQLLHEMPEWEADTDRILVMAPIVGSVFRKVWFDPAVKRNVSRLVTADNLVVNYYAPSLEAAPRITELLRLYPYEIEERIRDGRFLEFDYENVSKGDAPAQEIGRKDGSTDADDQDDSAPHLFLEQHRLLDLDEDGYPEPYIVTVHQGTQKIVRIVANFDADTVTIADDGRVASIRRQNYFVHYQFMPNPEGGFYALGFGWLLGSTNETINSTLNQLMDAGHQANMQGGLISSVLGIKEKSIKIKRGEFRTVNVSGPINQAVHQIDFPEPSAVLFNLLGLLIEMGKEVASVKDVLTGDSASTAAVGTTLALIEQGLQVFTSIYKRIHRTLRAELAIIGRLNFQNVTREKYVAFFDDPSVDPQADYNSSDMDILPVSDPQSVTKMQKLAKAQLVLESAKENPLVNQAEALRRFYEAADVEDIDKLIVPPPEPDPAEVAFMEAVKDLGLQEQMAKITELYTKSLKNVADAEAAEEGQQISLYDMFLRTVQAEHAMEQPNAQPEGGPGGISGMAGAAADPSGAPALQAGGPVDPGAGGTGLAQPVDQLGGGMGQPASPSGVPQGAL
jgi:chaperonin GroES